MHIYAYYKFIYIFSPLEIRIVSLSDERTNSQKQRLTAGKSFPVIMWPANSLLREKNLKESLCGAGAKKCLMKTPGLLCVALFTYKPFLRNENIMQVC